MNKSILKYSLIIIIPVVYLIVIYYLVNLITPDIIVNCVGGSYWCNKQEESYYNEQGDLIKLEDKCLKEIICQVPNITETTTLDFNLLAHESCYDLINDPDNIGEEVNRIFEEHPDNWQDYMNWTPHKLDPKITLITNNSIERITCVKVYIDRSKIENGR